MNNYYTDDQIKEAIDMIKGDSWKEEILEETGISEYLYNILFNIIKKSKQ